MSYTPTAYDTTVGSKIVTKNIKKALLEAFIKDGIQMTNLGLVNNLPVIPVGVLGNCASASEIPFFAHPIEVVDSKNKRYLCVDLRSYTVPLDEGTCSDSNVRIRNQTEYNFAMAREVFNLAWLTGSALQIKNDLSFAGTVYASWLSESISKRFALDPGEQIRLQILTHYFYQSLFYGTEAMDEVTKQKFAIHTIKATKASSELVFAVFDSIGKLDDINDYCENVKSIIGNIRLKELSAGVIVTIVGNSWFGPNAREVIAIALEFPPVWTALVYTAMTERSFKNSSIARIADRLQRNNAGKEFLKAAEYIFETYKSGESKAPIFNSFD